MKLNANNLLTAIQHTLPATADDEGVRPALEAIHIEIANRRCVLTGSDGWILVESAFDIDSDARVSALFDKQDIGRLAMLLRELFISPMELTISAQNEWTFAIGPVKYTAFPMVHTPPDYAKGWGRIFNYDETAVPIDLSLLRRAIERAPSHARMYSDGPRQAVIISARDYRALIMPMSPSTINDFPRASLRSEA